MENANEEENLNLDLAMEVLAAEEAEEEDASNSSSENDLNSTELEELSEDDDLYNGIASRDALAVHRALRNGTNVNSIFRLERAGTFCKATPLILACCAHDDSDASHQVVRMLLNKGADARWKNSDGLSAVLVACQNGHLSIVEMLLDHDNGLLEVAGSIGWTPLFFAVVHRQTDIVQSLLSRGANVKATDDYGKTALMVACMNSNLESMRLLLAEGRCDVDARDDAHLTALHYAASY